MEENPSLLTRFLVLGTLETLINQITQRNASIQSSLGTLHGTVVRLRMERPQFVFYVLIHEDGIELMTDYDGPVHVRVRTSTSALLYWALVPGAPLPSEQDLQLLGATDRIGQLAQLMAELSLWALVRQWLNDHVPLNDLLALVRREDPRWLGRLQKLPEQLDQVQALQARQQQQQDALLAEVRQLRDMARRSRRLDLLWLPALLAALAAWSSHLGHLPTLMSLTPDLQALGLAGLGGIFVVIRILRA